MRVSEEHVTHPDQAFRFLRLELAGFAGTRHRHPQVELTWIERGSGVRFVGDHTAPFADGDLVLLGPQLPHLWTGSAAPGAAPFLASVLQFPPALLDSALLPELAALRPLLDRARHGLAVQGECQTQLISALRDMANADALQRLVLLMGALRTLAQPGADLQPLSTSAARAGAHAQDQRRIDRVTHWIQQNLAAELNVQEAAAVAHVSPAAFSRFFKRETGKTWSAYINDVRCSEAGLRLRQSARPVAEVALACGYPTLSHFHREFAARFGVAPRDYRRRG